MKLPVEKNQTYTMSITDIGTNGEGIGRIDGYTVFVEGALPEEVIKVLIVKTKKHFGYGKLLEILEPSPHRVTPACPVAAKCGGCQLQHLSYEGQLSFKTKKVKDHLERIGGFSGISVGYAKGMEEPWRYRNKASSLWAAKPANRKSAFMQNAVIASLIPQYVCCKTKSMTRL